jgi:serine/threonine protein phosphatase PrpC
MWSEGHEPWWDPAGFALVGYVGHFNEWNRAEALVPARLAFTLLPGEKLVLCSDGITDYLAEDHPDVAAAIARLVVGEVPVVIAMDLVREANRAGGGDNATAIVAALARPG